MYICIVEDILSFAFLSLTVSL